MFKASNEVQLPTTNQRILSENGRNFSDGQVLEFFLPPSLGFCSFGSGGSEAFLRFDFDYTISQKFIQTGGNAEENAVLRLAPQRDKGMSGLIQSLRVADGKTNQVLEEILDYDVLASALISHDCGVNDGVWNKRTMVEGLVDNEAQDTPYYSSNTSFNNANGVGISSTKRTAKVCLPLHLSGILNSKRIFNVGATSGLRVHIVLQNASDFSVLRNADTENKCKSATTIANGAVVTSLRMKQTEQKVGNGLDKDTCPFVIGQGITCGDITTKITGITNAGDEIQLDVANVTILPAAATTPLLKTFKPSIFSVPLT